MFQRVAQIEARYDELTQALASPDIMNDSARFQKTAKAHSEISDIVEKYHEYKDLTRGIAESRAMLADETDADMRAYAEEELAKLDLTVAGASKSAIAAIEKAGGKITLTVVKAEKEKAA